MASGERSGLPFLLNYHGDPAAGFLYLPYLCVQGEIYPLLHENPFHEGSHLGIVPGEEARRHVNDFNPGAQVAKALTKLKPYGAASQDNELFRQFFQGKDAPVSEKGYILESRDGR